MFYQAVIRQKWPLLLACIILIMDQLSKILVQKYIPLWSKIPVFPKCFNLVHVLNRGAAFGFLNSPGSEWPKIFFTLMSIIAVLIILIILLTNTRKKACFSYGLGAVLGGALGNLIDRLRLGMVVDFLDVYFKQWHWPAFNLADMAITCGAISLIISLYTRGKHASDIVENRPDNHI